MVLLNFNLGMIFYVDLFQIISALLSRVVLLLLFMLCFLNYIQAPWLDILVVRNYLNLRRNDFTGKICMLPLSSLYVDVLFAQQTKVVLRKLLVYLLLLKIRVNHLNMLQWTLLLICLFLLEALIVFLRLLIVLVVQFGLSHVIPPFLLSRLLNYFLSIGFVVLVFRRRQCVTVTYVFRVGFGKLYVSL